MANAAPCAAADAQTPITQIDFAHAADIAKGVPLSLIHI